MRNMKPFVKFTLHICVLTKNFHRLTSGGYIDNHRVDITHFMKINYV